MFRKGKVFAAFVVFTLMTLTGCNGSTTQQTDGSTTTSESNAPPVETTVTIGGKEWTCAQITALEPQQCGTLTQQAFDSYKENIDAYVNSGKLGAFNDGGEFSYEHTAYAGLVACAYRLSGGDENDYINFMRKTPYFGTRMTEGVMYLPAWFEAPKSLCTDLKLSNQNPGSSRIP